MACGHLRRQLAIGADGGLLMDASVDALNRLKYAAHEQKYQDTVWGAFIGKDDYTGVKRYNYYGRKINNYNFNPRYRGNDNYGRTLGYRSATDEQPVYGIHRLPYENPTEHPTEQQRDDVSGILYLVARTNDSQNDRALELLNQIEQERAQGVRTAEVINFSERARVLHERIRDERRLIEGELSEAA